MGNYVNGTFCMDHGNMLHGSFLKGQFKKMINYSCPMKLIQPTSSRFPFAGCDVEVLVARFELRTSPPYFNTLATNSSHITYMGGGVKQLILEAGIHLIM
jgi:hypothetical protein